MYVRVCVCVCVCVRVRAYICIFFQILFHYKFFFFLFRVTSAAYGSSQARCQIGAVVLAYTIAIAVWDLSHIFDLHRSSRQCQILNPPSKARD